MFKVLFIKEFDNNTVPIRDGSLVATKEYQTYRQAKQAAEHFLTLDFENYTKIWNTKTNDVLFESKRHLY